MLQENGGGHGAGHGGALADAHRFIVLGIGKTGGYAGTLRHLWAHEAMDALLRSLIPTELGGDPALLLGYKTPGGAGTRESVGLKWRFVSALPFHLRVGTRAG